MNKLTAPLLLLLAPFAPCFNKPVHETFCLVVMPDRLAPGQCTISRVWQTTGLADEYDHSSSIASSIRPCGTGTNSRIFLVELLREFVPRHQGLIVDDTLSQTRRQGPFRRHLSRCRAQLPKAQDLPLRRQLGHLGTRGPTAFSPGSLLLASTCSGVFTRKRSRGYRTRPTSWATDGRSAGPPSGCPSEHFISLPTAAYISAKLLRASASERPGGWPDPPQSQSDVLPSQHRRRKPRTPSGCPPRPK